MVSLSRRLLHVKDADENSYPIFFVPLQGSMEKVSGHFFIFIQPHDDKWLKPATEQRRRKGNMFVQQQ